MICSIWTPLKYFGTFFAATQTITTLDLSEYSEPRLLLHFVGGLAAPTLLKIIFKLCLGDEGFILVKVSASEHDATETHTW
jgi:hypothetical protein